MIIESVSDIQNMPADEWSSTSVQAAMVDVATLTPEASLYSGHELVLQARTLRGSSERRNHMKKLARGLLVMTAVVVALMVAPKPAAAQEYLGLSIDRTSFYLGFSGMGNFILNQARAPVNGFIDHGGGFGFALGVRFVPMLALELAYTLNIHNPVQDASGDTIDALLMHAWTLDLKILFPNQSRVRPYLQVGPGVYELATYANATNYRNGVGFQLGGGLDIWLSRMVSIGGRVLYHGIFFTQYIYEYKPYLSTLSVDFNLQLHF